MHPMCSKFTGTLILKKQNIDRKSFTKFLQASIFNDCTTSPVRAASQKLSVVQLVRIIDINKNKITK